MKNIFQIISASLLLMGITIITTGCRSTKYQDVQGVTSTHLESVEELDPALPLSDHLRKLPGVSVIGSGANAKVMMRGFKSYSGDPEPLFLVDGNMIAGGFASVANSVNVYDIDYIRVIRDINERSRYGYRSANGVIEITTKKR